MMKFMKSVAQTMKDTTWLTAKQTRIDTSKVIVVSILFILFFAALDYLISLGLNAL